MALAARESFEQIRNDLASAIRTRRSDCIPHETARQLLVYDFPGHTSLVGLNHNCDKAVLYHQRDRYAIAVEFGSEGLADGGAAIAEFREGPGIEQWVEKIGAYWGWIHPRYR